MSQIGKRRGAVTVNMAVMRGSWGLRDLSRVGLACGVIVKVVEVVAVVVGIAVEAAGV